MTEAQQLKLVTKRSLQQTHISHASGSGDSDEGKDGDGDEEDDGEEGDGDNDDEDDDGEEGDDDDDQEVVRDDDKDDEKDDEEEGGDNKQEYDEDEYDEETKDEESFDPISKTPKNSNDEGNGDEDLGLNVGGEEEHVKEEDKLYRNVNINQGRGIQETLDVEDLHVTLTPVNPDGQQQSSSVLRILEANFSEAMQTNQFAGAVSAIPGIVQQYMDQRMNEAVKVAVQIQSDHLRDEAQRENDEFLKTVDENMQKIIKEQVKGQVKIQVSKILPRIEQTVNEQLEAEILIEKMEGNKSIQRSNEQRNLYKALVEAYESNKIILDTYGETVTLKRHRDDDANKDEEPSAGPDRGSKRRKERKEPESASANESTFAEEPVQTTCQMKEPSHLEFDTGAKDQPIVQSF
nr:hypothetical protein [Tanacetum cinerariifolium]